MSTRATFCQAMVLLTLCQVTFARPVGDGNRSSIAPTKGVEIGGKVSGDGKAFVADDDNEWRVANTETLKGLEGRYITIRCRMDVAGRSIRVLSVKQPPENFRGAHLGDAAFRR